MKNYIMLNGIKFKNIYILSEMYTYKLAAHILQWKLKSVLWI